MSGTSAHSKKQLLKLWPLYCLTKESDYTDSVVINKTSSTPKAQLEVPEPIDEFIDYRSDANYERSAHQLPEMVLAASDSGEELSATSMSDGPAVEEVIQVSVFGQAETGLSEPFDTKQSARERAAAVGAAPASYSLRKAEGFAIGFDKSPRGAAAASDAPGVPHPFSDLMADDSEVFVPGPASRTAAADSRGAGSPGASQSVVDTSRSLTGADPSDVRALKRTVRRLTSELSRLLTSAPRADGNSVDVTEGRKQLPGKGPLPPWLCEPRVFAPLLAAYDQRLSLADGGSASGGAGASEARMLEMEARVLDVVRENERLRVKLREAATAGPASQTEMDAFTEQARLVLEENQLLIHQLDVQQEKAKWMQRDYTTEVVKLKCRIEELEAENSQVRGEFDSWHGKLQEVKSKYQSAALERETGEMKTVDCMRSLSRELCDAREEFVHSNEELLRHLQKSEREKVKLTEALADASTERDRLRIEVSELRSAVQLRHKQNIYLQKSAKKQDALQEYLESVVTAATDLQSELDTCNEKLEDQEAELARLISYLVNELKFHEKDSNGQATFEEESLNKMPKLTAKFEFVIKRFVTLLKGNEDKREQMDKQIRYLQSLLRHKSQELQHLEAEQRIVEAGLETVWNSAVSN